MTRLQRLTLVVVCAARPWSDMPRVDHHLAHAPEVAQQVHDLRGREVGEGLHQQGGGTRT